VTGRIRAIVGALAVSMAAGAPAAEVPAGRPPGLELTGNLSRVHDPTIIHVDAHYFVFATGQARDETGLVPVRVSSDLLNWELRGAVFPDIPAWAAEHVPGTRGIWAPDISHRNGEYRLYYSISTFGRNRSAIGLTVNTSLDPQAPGTGWTDRGPVIESHSSDNFNAIDPNAFDDADGRQWLVFGSFWSGIKMVRLDPATGMRSSEDQRIYALASRRRPGAVEAPFIIRHDNYYYLFASFDFCCRGVESTYYTVVGRSRDPTGPYVDRDDRAMMEGGGFLVLHADLDPTRRFVGPGHSAILQDGGRDYIVYHAYDRQADGAPTLRIQPLGWTEDGWPVAI